MVRYDSKDWLKNLTNFYKSHVLRQLLTYVLLAGGLTALLCFVVIDLMIWEVRLTSSIFSLLGIILSILLVFRTNTAYDRWWEGRKQWGALVNNCRNLATMLQTMLPAANTDDRAYFAKHIANFCMALKEHLRQGVRLQELLYLLPEEVVIYQSKQHIPNFIGLQIFQRLQRLHQQGIFTEADMINLLPKAHALLDILGACERIKKTPIPFSYNVYIKAFIVAYCLILPFGLIEEFQYYTVPLVMFIFFAMAGVELIGEEIEDPFGLNCNDLPTGSIAETIRSNVYEILCLDSEVDQPQEEKQYERVF